MQIQKLILLSVKAFLGGLKPSNSTQSNTIIFETSPNSCLKAKAHKEFVLLNWKMYEGK